MSWHERVEGERTKTSGLVEVSEDDDDDDEEEETTHGAMLGMVCGWGGGKGGTDIRGHGKEREQ